MSSTAEIWVFNKLLELTERYGANPMDAEIFFEYVSEPGPEGHSYYVMSVMDTLESLPEEEARQFKKVQDLLGLDSSGGRRFNNLDEVKEVVDHALSLAPRARTR